MTKVRDYRDEADVDDTLDAIRVGPRDQAKRLFRATLDTAYQQGILDGIDKCIKSLRQSLDKSQS